MIRRLEKPLLRAARALLGYSQQYVSEQVKVSSGTMAHLENDDRKVKLETELKVRDFYQEQGVEFVVTPDNIGVFIPVRVQETVGEKQEDEASKGPHGSEKTTI